MQLSIVIPAYNEAKRIGLTLQQLERFITTIEYPVEIIIVDDGSTDGTHELVKQTHYAHVQIIQQPNNQGKFAAFKRGVEAAQYGWILLYDADGATPITMLNQFWPLTQHYDCLIGSRRTADSQITVPQSWLRTILGRCAYLTIRFCTGLTYKDTQCGFKLCAAGLLKQVVQQATIAKFTGDVELLYLLTLHGARLKEVPVEWHDVPQGTVHLRDYYYSLRDVFKIRRNIRTGQYQSKSDKA